MMNEINNVKRQYWRVWYILEGGHVARLEACAGVVSEMTPSRS
jgi:hypothetical protein